MAPERYVTQPPFCSKSGLASTHRPPETESDNRPAALADSTRRRGLQKLGRHFHSLVRITGRAKQASGSIGLHGRPGVEAEQDNGFVVLERQGDFGQRTSRRLGEADIGKPTQIRK